MVYIIIKERRRATFINALQRYKKMAKYYIDNDLVEKDEFWKQFEDDVNSEAEDNFDDYLDECEEEVEIFGSRFSPSRILQELDYTMYNCMLGDYQSQMLDEKKDDLEKFGFVDVNHSYYEIKDEEEEEEENDA